MDKQMYKVLQEDMRTPYYSMKVTPGVWYEEPRIEVASVACARGLHAVPIEGLFYPLHRGESVWECEVDGREVLLGPLFSRFERLKVTRRVPFSELKERCREWEGPFDLERVLFPFDEKDKALPDVLADFTGKGKKWRKRVTRSKGRRRVFEDYLRAVKKIKDVYSFNTRYHGLEDLALISDHPLNGAINAVKGMAFYWCGQVRKLLNSAEPGRTDEGLYLHALTAVAAHLSKVSGVTQMGADLFQKHHFISTPRKEFLPTFFEMYARKHGG